MTEDPEVSTLHGVEADDFFLIIQTVLQAGDDEGHMRMEAGERESVHERLQTLDGCHSGASSWSRLSGLKKIEKLERERRENTEERKRLTVSRRGMRMCNWSTNFVESSSRRKLSELRASSSRRENSWLPSGRTSVSSSLSI